MAAKWIRGILRTDYGVRSSMLHAVSAPPTLCRAGGTPDSPKHTVQRRYKEPHHHRPPSKKYPFVSRQTSSLRSSPASSLSYLLHIGAADFASAWPVATTLAPVRTGQSTEGSCACPCRVQPTSSHTTHCAALPRLPAAAPSVQHPALQLQNPDRLLPASASASLPPTPPSRASDGWAQTPP